MLHSGLGSGSIEVGGSSARKSCCSATQSDVEVDEQGQAPVEQRPVAERDRPRAEHARHEEEQGHPERLEHRIGPGSGHVDAGETEVHRRVVEHHQHDGDALGRVDPAFAHDRRERRLASTAARRVSLVIPAG